MRINQRRFQPTNRLAGQVRSDTQCVNQNETSHLFQIFRPVRLESGCSVKSQGKLALGEPLVPGAH